MKQRKERKKVKVKDCEEGSFVSNRMDRIESTVALTMTTAPSTSFLQTESSVFLLRVLLFFLSSISLSLFFTTAANLDSNSLTGDLIFTSEALLAGC